jgi:hypothetical protein
MKANLARLTLALACVGYCAGTVLAQTQPDPSTPASPHSTGRTLSPETKGQKQPQGYTGPTETTGRSAPAESPQGQTPPGTHAAPEGSSKTTVEPSK